MHMAYLAQSLSQSASQMLTIVVYLIGETTSLLGLLLVQWR